jgi:hypothetical protein
MSDTILEIENTSPSKGDSDVRIIMKIRALLAKAAAASTDAEREAYNAKAAELSAQYGVQAAGSTEDDMEIKEYTIEGNFPEMTGRLLYYVQEAVGCKAIITNNGAGVTVVGYCSDVSRGDVLYTCLGLEMNSGAAKMAEGGATAPVVEGWMLGFITTANERLQDAEKRARARGNQDLLAKRAAKVAETFAEEFPHIRRGGRSSYNMSAFGAGARAGSTADIGQGRFGAGRRAIG